MAGPFDWLQQLLGGYDRIPPGGTDLDALGYADQVLQGRLPYRFDRPYGTAIPDFAPPQEPPSYALPGSGTRLTADLPQAQPEPPQEPTKPFRYPDPQTIPFPASYDTWTPSNPQGSAIDNLLTKLGDVGRAGAGIAERFNLAGANLLDSRVWFGEEKPRGGEIPVAPGLGALADATTFATAGLTAPLSPMAGTINQGVRFAARAPKDALTTILDTLPSYDPNTLTVGGMAGMTRGLTPAQLAQRRRMEQRRMMGYGPEPEPLPPLETPPPAIGSNTAQFSVPPVEGTQIPPIGLLDPAIVAMGRLAAPGSRTLNALPVPEDVDAAMRRKLARTDPNIGAVKNPEAIQLPIMPGVPYGGIWLGPVSAQQWAHRAETVLGDRIEEAGRWYADALPAYENAFGREMAPKMLGAWLIANQNVDPGGAQLNALRALEQYRAHTQGKPDTKRPGLAEAALFRYWDAVLSGDHSILTGGGSSQKIYDFIDSAAGKTTRTFYGDDPRAGQPAVADVHTLRDTGTIDPTLHDWIRTNYGDEVANRFQMDPGSSPSETKYEWSSDKVRQWTQDLNAMNWRGRSDWTPAEIQAIGWKTMSELMGRAGMTPEEGILHTQRLLSYELDFGRGAPWNKTFPEWKTLTRDEKARVTEPIVSMIMNKALEITGASEGWRRAGTGAWKQDLNPSFRSQLLASDEATMDVAHILGYLGQQTEIYGTRLIPQARTGSKLAASIYGQGLDDPARLEALWKEVYTTHPDLAAGFSPVVRSDGTPGIQIGFDRGGAALANKIKNELMPTIDAISQRDGIEYRVVLDHALTIKPTNNWRRNPDGKSYLRRLQARYGPDIQRRLDDYSAAELEPALRQEIAEAIRRRGQGGGAAQGRGTAPAIGAGLLGGGLLGSSGAGAATYQPPPQYYDPLADLQRRLSP